MHEENNYRSMAEEESRKAKQKQKYKVVFKWWTPRNTASLISGERRGRRYTEPPRIAVSRGATGHHTAGGRATKVLLRTRGGPGKEKERDRNKAKNHRTRKQGIKRNCSKTEEGRVTQVRPRAGRRSGRHVGPQPGNNGRGAAVRRDALATSLRHPVSL